MTNGIYDAAIVGCGPSGASLANFLGLYGFRVLVLERAASAYPLPRAVHLDDEVMRVFQAIGLADAIHDKVRINAGMHFVDKDQNMLVDWSRPQSIGPYGWYPSYRFHQPDIEAILHQGMTRFSNVDMRWCATVTSISQTENHALITFDDDGTSAQAKARFVIGCDGARSLIRHYICASKDTVSSDDIMRINRDDEMHDLGFEERWLVLDGLLKRPRPDLGDFTIQTCDPDRPSTYARQPENWRRWEVSLKDDETDDYVRSDEFVWSFLAPRVTADDISIERRAVYTFQSKLARYWRRGRVMIAGDAAHLTPPFMGQGMCIGIRDVANLAWKLAYILRGGAMSILDSYDSERAPHARAYIEMATYLGNLLNSCETADGLRTALSSPQPQMDNGQVAGNAKMQSIAPRLGAGIGDSSDPLRGYRSPQPQLADGRLLDDLIGLRWAIVSRHDHAPALSREDICVVSDVNEPNVTAMLDDLGALAVIMRPDRYIHAVIDDAQTFSSAVATIPD